MENEDEFGIVGVTLANAFHVEKVVAHGGFAVVYRGIHGGFRAPIALKCLRIPEGMTPEQHNTFLEKFREEGELLFRLSAAIPEVVRPLHIDAVMLPTGELMPFLALEWLEGEGFDQVIDRNQRDKRTGLELLKVLDTLRPVAQALIRAHSFPTERGSLCVVHRDLKPENLFLCQVAGKPSIKILDYGIAEVVSVAQKVSGGWRDMNPFTPGYGAPEQWAPDRFGASGPWTDVWGLAITVTEALLGRPPIDGEVDQMRRICLDPRRRPTPRSLGCSVSNAVEAVFQKALALDPKARTQDIESFWRDLERAAGTQVTVGAAAMPMSRKRRAERELEDSEGHSSLDLDLAVAPESLRNPPRQSPVSVPPPPGGSNPGMPAFRLSPSSPALMRPAFEEEGAEADLPMIDHSPSEQPVPASGPRSVRVTPVSMRTPLPGPGVVYVGRDDEAPVSRPSLPTEERYARIDLSREQPASPVSEVAAVIKGRFRTPSILLGVAICITLVDVVFVRVSGEALTLGPVRPLWIAGPMAVIGALLLVWKIVSDD